MALVSSMCAFAATPHTMGAEGEIWCSVQPPDLIRQSCDAFDTLGPPQRLTGRGSVFNSVVDSVGRERRHREWWCHRRQCDKRGVSPNSGTPSCSQNTGSRDPPANIQRLRSPISPMSGDERSVMYPTRSRLVGRPSCENIRLSMKDSVGGRNNETYNSFLDTIPSDPLHLCGGGHACQRACLGRSAMPF